MKTSILYTASLFLTTAVAFPANLLNGDISSETLAEINSIVARIEREAAASEKRQLGFGLVKPGFDADAQRVSNTGTHRYIAPGPNDIRGPCPGLNILANHGYISRTGVASVLDLTTASTKGLSHPTSKIPPVFNFNKNG